MISIYLYCWRVEDVPSFLFPLVGPCLQTHTNCKSASCWSLNPARAQNRKAKPGSRPTFIFEAWFGPESQIHRVLISSTLSPSQKQRETNPSREEKKASAFSNRISWRKSQSLHSQKLPRWAQKIYIKKENILTPNATKYVLYAGPKSHRNILTNLSPSPARSEKPGLTYNSAPCQQFYSKSFTVLA